MDYFDYNKYSDERYCTTLCQSLTRKFLTHLLRSPSKLSCMIELVKKGHQPKMTLDHILCCLHFRRFLL